MQCDTSLSGRLDCPEIIERHSSRNSQNAELTLSSQGTRTRGEEFRTSVDAVDEARESQAYSIDHPRRRRQRIKQLLRCPEIHFRASQPYLAREKPNRLRWFQSATPTGEVVLLAYPQVIHIHQLVAPAREASYSAEAT
jgi:hypothetical protein